MAMMCVNNDACPHHQGKGPLWADRGKAVRSGPETQQDRTGCSSRPSSPGSSTQNPDLPGPLPQHQLHPTAHSAWGSSGLCMDGGVWGTISEASLTSSAPLLGCMSWD